MDTMNNINEGGIYISGELWFDFLLRLIVNIVSIFILIRFVYYPRNSRATYLFTFFLMGMMIFLIASILDQVSLNIGFALGLFAIFGIIRYRSPSIDLKEMTYLFLVIGVSIINALVEFNVANWLGLVIANLIIILSALAMESYLPKQYVLKRSLVFAPSSFSILNNNKRLLEEVRKDTGIDVLRVEISKLNKTKNEVTLWIYFRENNESYQVKVTKPEPEPPAENNSWVNTSSNEF